MAEKLNVKRMAFSFAMTLALFYLLWAMLLYLIPDAMVNVLKDLFQGIDVTKIARPSIPIGSVLTGLIEILFIGLIFGWLFGEIYNWLLRY
jgi:hypothetical protein